MNPSPLGLMMCLGPPRPPRLQPLLPWAWAGGRGEVQGLSGQKAEKGKKSPNELKRSLEIVNSRLAIHGQLRSFRTGATEGPGCGGGSQSPGCSSPCSRSH